MVLTSPRSDVATYSAPPTMYSGFMTRSGCVLLYGAYAGFDAAERAEQADTRAPSPDSVTCRAT